MRHVMSAPISAERSLKGTMFKTPFRRWIAVWVAMGFAIPITLLALQLFVLKTGDIPSIYLLHRITMRLWPSSIMLMATEGIEHSASAYVFIAISVAVNVVLYAVVAAILWALLSYFRLVGNRSQ